MALKVVFVNPPVRVDQKPRNLPHGLAILANIVRKKAGIIPVFLDVNARRYSAEETEGLLRDIQADVVLTGGVASAYRYIVELSALIKKIRPGTKIIVGGYVAMPDPELLLENSDTDIVCTGEGEITLAEMLQKFSREGIDADISGVRGLCYKTGDGRTVTTSPMPFIEDLDRESDLPAYDLLPMDVYCANPVAGIGRDIDMVTIRGCPFRCSFCYQPWGSRPRAHSIEFISAGILHLKKVYHVDFISFQDDEFMVDAGRVTRFCETRNRLFPDLLWSCTGRANIVSKNEGLVEMMRSAGCTLISCGFESGSPRMLESMHKHQTIAQMEKTVAVLRRNGLPVPASFIIGMPGEDRESCRETLDFCLRNNLPLDSLMFATPYPGTEIFQFALETGRIRREDLHRVMMRIGDAREFRVNLTDSFTDEELIATRNEMMRIAGENYKKYISEEEIIGKMKALFGPLLEKTSMDSDDIEHRAKHGGISTF